VGTAPRGVGVAAWGGGNGFSFGRGKICEGKVKRECRKVCVPGVLVWVGDGDGFFHLQHAEDEKNRDPNWKKGSRKES
jgi:hypothetical protein